MAVRAGRMRDRITFQEMTSSQDPETGQPIDAPVDLFTVWANVTDLSGRRFFEAAAAQSEVTTEVRMRYRDDVKPEMTIKHGGRQLEIRAIQRPENRRRELLILASELGAAT